MAKRTIRASVLPPIGGHSRYNRRLDPSNLRAIIRRFDVSIVSGAVTQAACSSAVRLSLLPI